MDVKFKIPERIYLAHPPCNQQNVTLTMENLCDAPLAARLQISSAKVSFRAIPSFTIVHCRSTSTFALRFGPLPEYLPELSKLRLKVVARVVPEDFQLDAAMHVLSVGSKDEKAELRARLFPKEAETFAQYCHVVFGAPEAGPLAKIEEADENSVTSPESSPEETFVMSPTAPVAPESVAVVPICTIDPEISQKTPESVNFHDDLPLLDIGEVVEPQPEPVPERAAEKEDIYTTEPILVGDGLENTKMSLTQPAIIIASEFEGAQRDTLAKPESDNENEEQPDANPEPEAEKQQEQEQEPKMIAVPEPEHESDVQAEVQAEPEVEPVPEPVPEPEHHDWAFTEAPAAPAAEPPAPAPTHQPWEEFEELQTSKMAYEAHPECYDEPEPEPECEVQPQPQPQPEVELQSVPEPEPECELPETAEKAAESVAVEPSVELTPATVSTALNEAVKPSVTAMSLSSIPLEGINFILAIGTLLLGFIIGYFSH